MKQFYQKLLILLPIMTLSCSQSEEASDLFDDGDITHKLELIGLFGEHKADLTRIKISGGTNPHVVAFDHWGGKSMWDGRTGKRLWGHFPSNPGRIIHTLAVDFSPDGTSFTSGLDQSLLTSHVANGSR